MEDWTKQPESALVKYLQYCEQGDYLHTTVDCLTKDDCEAILRKGIRYFSRRIKPNDDYYDFMTRLTGDNPWTKLQIFSECVCIFRNRRQKKRRDMGIYHTSCNYAIDCRINRFGEFSLHAVKTA